MNAKAEQQEFVLPKKTLTTEFFVGIFSIIGVLCLAYLAMNIAQIRFFSTNFYNVIAEFDNVSGLAKGASVEIAGVPIGKVKTIDLSNSRAKVTMEIEKQIKLRDDDIVAIRTKGIIGDRYVKVIPGASEKTITAGGAISDTESVVDIEDMVGKFLHRMD